MHNLTDIVHAFCSALFVYKLILSFATIYLCVKEDLELFLLLKSKDDAQLNNLHSFYQPCLQIAQFFSCGWDVAFWTPNHATL